MVVQGELGFVIPPEAAIIGVVPGSIRYFHILCNTPVNATNPSSYTTNMFGILTARRVSGNATPITVYAKPCA